MKHDHEEKCEKLYEALDCAREEYLNEALETDSKERFDVLGKHNGQEKKRARFLSPAGRAILISCACLALVAAVLFSLPGLRSLLFSTSAPEDPDRFAPLPAPAPRHSSSGEDWKIDSIDKLNYYSALAAIFSSGETSGSAIRTGASASYRKNRVLSDQNDPEPVVENTKEAAETRATEENGDQTPAQDVDYNYLVYDLGENTVFTIDKVYFFQIELTDESGFLASKIGCGTVDVVINNLGFEENLITFKNNDKFYSCLQFGGSGNDMIFGTYRYIEGFCLIKNLKQTNYSFHVTVNGEYERQVTSFECQPSETKNPGKNPDSGVRIASKTIFCRTNFSFKLGELDSILKELRASLESAQAQSAAEQTPDDQKTLFDKMILRDYLQDAVIETQTVRIAENDESRPEELTFLIRSDEDYRRFFVGNAPEDDVPVGIDFDQKSMVLYTYRAWDTLNLELERVYAENGTVHITLEPLKTPGYPLSCVPFQRWIAVVIDRTDAEQAEVAIRMPPCLDPLIDEYKGQ